MAAPGQPPPPPTPPAATAPEGAPGSVPEQQPGQGQEGFWGRFPTVPEEMRGQLEPHLKQVQAHVTRLEQQLAPFKGMSPQAVTGLASFAKQFDANPAGMFLRLAADLQKRGVIHENLDIEALQAVMQGQDPDEGEELDVGDNVGGEENGNDPWANAPPWALELQQQLEAQKEKEATQQRRQQEQVEDRALQATISKMRAAMKEAGYPEEYLTEQRLNAQLLTHMGNATAAVQDAVDARNTMLKGVVKPSPSDEEPNMPRGVPKHGKTRDPSDAMKRRDPIKAAGSGAEQYLRTAARDAQQ
jgi:hypothetical protein